MRVTATLGRSRRPRLLPLLLVLAASGSKQGSGGPCDPNPCKHDSLCDTGDEGGYSCICEKGFEGKHCEVETNECQSNVCKHGGKCIDLVNAFRCDCRFGYSGTNCENVDFWTLQQWKSFRCLGDPWRCFRLQVNRCVDTGLVDGLHPNRAHWYGRLVEDGHGKYSLDLCFGHKGKLGKEPEDGEVRDIAVPESWCECDNHFGEIPRLGKNSLGPGHKGLEEPDSDECHNLVGITSSRLQNSTGQKDDEEQLTNIICPQSSAQRQFGQLCGGLAVLLGVFLAACTSPLRDGGDGSFAVRR